MSHSTTARRATTGNYVMPCSFPCRMQTRWNIVFKMWPQRRLMGMSLSTTAKQLETVDGGAEEEGRRMVHWDLISALSVAILVHPQCQPRFNAAADLSALAARRDGR